MWLIYTMQYNSICTLEYTLFLYIPTNYDITYVHIVHEHIVYYTMLWYYMNIYTMCILQSTVLHVHVESDTGEVLRLFLKLQSWLQYV